VPVEGQNPYGAVRHNPLACHAAMRHTPAVTMRPITRYGSRKLYDTHERRYVSLEDLARHVRAGEHLRVTDKRTGQDVTAQTLALVVYEQARAGAGVVTSELLHDVIRSGVGQLTEKVEQLVQTGVDRVRPLQRAREEMQKLRAGMAGIERTLRDLATGDAAKPARRTPRGARKQKGKRK
jgi:polyhydroxyalkanoate synthesis repressor PhaR